MSLHLYPWYSANVCVTFQLKVLIFFFGDGKISHDSHPCVAAKKVYFLKLFTSFRLLLLRHMF